MFKGSKIKELLTHCKKNNVDKYKEITGDTIVEIDFRTSKPVVKQSKKKKNRK